MASISKVLRHNHRAPGHVPPNAAPGVAPVVLHGTTVAGGMAKVRELLPEQRRKDATLAYEAVFVLGAEFFRPHNPGAAGEFDKDRAEAFGEATRRFLEKMGGVCVSATMHLDESTPHVQAVFVPLTDDGRLSAKDMLTPGKLRKLQTDWAKHLKSELEARFPDVSIERGADGSSAKHQSVKDYYRAVNAAHAPSEPKRGMPVEPPPVPPLTERSEARLKAWQKESMRAAAAATIGINNMPALSTKAASYDRTAKALYDERRKTERARLRDIPLESVAEMLGFERDPADPKRNWRTPLGRVTIKDQKFFCHDVKAGGGGAIDFVMRTLEVDFDEACRQLGGSFDDRQIQQAAMLQAARAAKEAASKPAPFPEPSTDPQDRAAVRRWLTATRKLPERVVDAAMEAGRVVAVRIGRFVNAAFAQGSNLAKPDGYELHGIGEVRFKRTVKRDKAAGRQLVMFPLPGARKVAFCESGVEALSYMSQNPGVAAASTSGEPTADAVDVARQIKEKGLEVIAAFNADAAGDAMAKKFAGATRDRPPEGMDWNDLQRAPRSLSRSSPVPR